MIESQKTSSENPNWWRGAVIYQIYPRSYFDANGDGIGDLQGITSKLDYIASLQIDAIWISPFFTSPMKDFGYDVSNYRQVDPIFGTLDDFKILLSEAHRLGIKVIIDQVLSHSSDQHPWFTESRQNRTNPKADWYVWQDPKPDGTPPTNWQSVFGGTAWQWDARREQYYLHNFLQSQPDLNFQNPEVQQQMLEELRFWLDLGVDGFRLDTVNYYFHDSEFRDNPAVEPPPEKIVNPYYCQQHRFDKNRPDNAVFTQQLRATLNQYSQRMLVGEIGDQRAEKMMQEYTGGGNRLHTAYSFRLLSEEFGASHFADVINTQEALLEDGWPTWAFSNHDVTRVASRWGSSYPQKQQPAIYKTLMMLLCSLRGSVCIYQGEELGLTEADIPYEQLQDPWGITFWPEYKGRDGCRTPMPWKHNQQHASFSEVTPWLPVPEEHVASAVDNQETDANSLLHFTRDLLLFRKQHPPLCVGIIKNVNVQGDLLSFTREHQNQQLTCVFWFGKGQHEFALSDNQTVKFASDKTRSRGDYVEFDGPGGVIL